MRPERFSCRIYGVLRRGRSVLLTRSVFCRHHEDHKMARLCSHPGGREFVNYPGGGVDIGEAPIEALRREYREETGLTIKPVRVLYASEGMHPSAQLPIQIVSVYWLIERVSGKLRRGGNGDDILKLFWVDFAKVPTAEMFPSDLEFTRRLPSLL